MLFKFLKVLVIVLFYSACFEKDNFSNLPNSKQKSTKFETSFSYKGTGNSIEAKNCFSNMCTVFKYPQDSNKSEIKDLVWIYQVYFAKDFRYKKEIEALNEGDKALVLDKYGNICGKAKNLPRCIFLNLAKSNKVECIFIRRDEGQQNIIKEDCKKWVGN